MRLELVVCTDVIVVAVSVQNIFKPSSFDIWFDEFVVPTRVDNERLGVCSQNEAVCRKDPESFYNYF